MRFIFVLLLFLSANSFAQQSKMDLLITMLKKDKEDTSKVNHLTKLSQEYEIIGGYDTASYFANNALQLAQKISYKKGIANSLHNIGSVYDDKGNYPEALKNYFAALKIREEVKDKQGIASSYNNIGNVYQDQADYPKALDYYFKALKMAEELGNKQLQANTHNNIAINYDEQADYTKALDYYFRALKMNEKLENKNGISRNLGNIGSAYLSIGKRSKRVGLFLNALDYYFKALTLAEELGSKKQIAAWLGNIGSVYFEQKKYAQAVDYESRAVKIANQIGVRDYEKEFHQMLYETYKAMGNVAKALEHYEKSMELKDTLFNEEKNKEITRREMNYEFDKKEAATKAEHDKQLAVSAAESKRQKVVIWSVISGLLSVVLFSGFIVRSLRVTRKQKQIIEIKSKETEEQKKLVDEKNRNITDSINYAKRIQESLMLSEEEINKMLPYESFVFYQPKDIVSGDFYWLSPVNDNGNALYVTVVADCTGHGVPGAFLSMMGNMLLNEIIIEKHITDPALILKEIHHGIFNSLHRENETNTSLDGMDVAICVIDPANQVIQYAGAMNPLYIMRQDKGLNEAKLEVIKADILSLGGKIRGGNLATDISFTNHTIAIEKGMSLYLFSDGYMDQFNTKQKLRFGSKQFKQLLIESAHLPMKQQKEKLRIAFNDWMDDKQIDDVLVMGINI